MNIFVGNYVTDLVKPFDCVLRINMLWRRSYSVCPKQRILILNLEWGILKPFFRRNLHALCCLYKGKMIPRLRIGTHCLMTTFGKFQLVSLFMLVLKQLPFNFFLVIFHECVFFCFAYIDLPIFHVKLSYFIGFYRSDSICCCCCFC